MRAVLIRQLLAIGSGFSLMLALGCSRSPRVADSIPSESGITAGIGGEPIDAAPLDVVEGLGEVIDLRLKLQVGQTFPMEMVKHQASEVTIMGQSSPTRRSEAVEGTWEVLQTNVYRDFVNMRFTFDRVRLSEFSNKGSFGYDSAEEGSQPQGERSLILSGMVGQSLEVTIMPSGRIVDMRGGDALRERIFTDATIGEMVNDVQALERLRTDTLSDESLALFLETYLATLPGTVYRVGSSWTELRQLPKMYSVNERRIELKEMKDGIVTVTRQSIMKPRSEGGTMGQRMSEMLAMQIDSGNFTTTSKVSAQNGWVKEAVTTGEMHMTLIMAALEAAEMPRPPMRTAERIIVRLLDDGVEPTPNIEVGDAVQ